MNKNLWSWLRFKREGTHSSVMRKWYWKWLKWRCRKQVATALHELKKP